MQKPTRGEHAPVAAKYDIGNFVACDGRYDTRVGRIEQVWPQPPILYRLTLARIASPWYAYEDDLRPATEEEVAGWHAAGGSPGTALPEDGPLA